MKKLLMGLVLALVMSIGISAADNFEFAFGPSYYFVPNYTTDGGLKATTNGKLGANVQFTWNLTENIGITPSFNAYWYNADLSTYAPYFKASATTNYYLFDVDFKYTFNPKQKVNFYAVAGPTWSFNSFSTLGQDETTSKLGYNIGLGVSFPVVKPQYRIIVEGKYYGLPNTVYPNALQNGNQNNFNLTALFGFRF